ncbi:MAG: hypothetical protein JWN98_2075, partial [Abditibacteriota bacterium]|nr:hypothetical protein [Abditibacteriota bacterium]
MKSLFPRRLCQLSLCGIPLLIGFGAGAASRTKPAASKSPTARATLPLRTLIVGGGPSAKDTQYAIESNTRYLDGLTGAAHGKTILFADGSKMTRSVNAVEETQDEVATALAFLFDEPWPQERLMFHPPLLRRIDGAASTPAIARALRDLGSSLKSRECALLYFTGHGFPGEVNGRDDFENTRYALWGDSDLSVRELAAMLRPLPANRPVVLVMVQCHAGGFANLLFQNGDPNRPLSTRDFCGFFAAPKDRMSAGCTPEIDERNYHDFTTHFFAALSGRTRDNRALSGADYDGDKRVSMLEAYAWANLNDQSIDVPICTSDTYLRHIFRDDTVWQQTPYSQLISWSAPWQKVMLEGLSRQLKLTGEMRTQSVWREALRHRNEDEDSHQNVDATRSEAALKRRAALIQT